MSIIETSLDEVRQQVDRIDDQLHDLLMQRAALLEEIRVRDGGATPVVRPIREAAILRRLAARHAGTLPLGTVVRIWREIMGAPSLAEQSLAVAVAVADGGPGAWDLARDQFGSQVPMTAYRSGGQVIRAVVDRSVAIGVLPLPAEQDQDPWWRQILSRDPATPRVIARLPFLKGGNARSAGDMLAVAAHVPDLTLFERVLLAVECPAETSRARLVAALGTVGLGGTVVAFDASHQPALALVDAPGPIERDDPRFAEFSAQLGVRSDICHLGGYSEPLAAQTPPRPPAP